MPEYTLIALCSVLLVLGIELLWLRTGILRTAQFWLSMLIVWGFQIPVDGWLTKAEGTIVGYDPQQITGLRVGWNSPIEDFAFGFSMITLTLLVWQRVTRPDTQEASPEPH
ncbi:MAG TPA: lycopene cyclase domain-containing protein [Ornithinimicrobium sp.]|uniref:lycopene cyclase domain-containing protein n=1 Tax=Ornithinimicrobium sp. TaxID=1977084 RepID=UPI002B46EDAE|nr:lycopene cyclase domain-containing protein [Ornithinimicrobium sp.]HKJ13110.1 lycopene cyclase domain-containing protein [Ornithinimicrobium sp.]